MGEDAYYDDRDEDFDEPVCERCRGDGMDPWCDYMLPCPDCHSEQYAEIITPTQAEGADSTMGGLTE